LRPTQWLTPDSTIDLGGRPLLVLHTPGHTPDSMALFDRRPLPAGSNGFVAESFSVDDGHAYQAAFIDYPLKLIYVEEGRRFSLFDLSRDPSERRPLEPASDPRAAPLVRALVGYLEHVR
jgi:hypothetical protein